MLSAPMEQRLEGVHGGFLRLVKKFKAKIMKEGLWQKVAAEKVLQGAGTQTLQTYLYRRQVKVVKWVASRPIFEDIRKGDRLPSRGGSGSPGGDRPQQRNI